MNWIPVTERLPEPFTTVLVWVVGDPGGPDFSNFGTYNDKTKRFLVNWGDDDVEVEVSHWMPEPEPPK